MADIITLKAKLENDQTSEAEIIEILESLQKQDINEEVIRKTLIGVAVGKLRKSKNTKISNEASGLVEKWKKLVKPSNNKNNIPSTNASPSTIKKETNSKSNGKDSVKIEKDDKKRKNDKEDSKESLKLVLKKQKNGEYHEESNKKSKKEINSDDEKDKKSSPSVSSKKSRSNDEDSSTRSKIVNLFVEALGTHDDYTLDVQTVASEIEEKLYSMFNSTNQAYKTKFRSLLFNLKNPKNPDLRLSVMQGSVDPVRLCSMTPQEMASEELKLKRREALLWHLEAAKDKGGNETSTDMFKCGKCGARDTCYTQLQTRSADEPMTTFHKCNKCGKRWKS